MSGILVAPLAQGIDIRGGFSDAWRSVVLFMPKLLGFLLILVIGWLIARGLRTLVDKVLERLHFDRAVERGGIGRALANSRYDASDLVARLVYYAVLLIVLQLAFGVFGPNPVSSLISSVVAWLPKAIVAIIIIVVAAAIAGAVRDLMTGALGGLSYGPMLAKLTSWFIIGLGVIAALNQIGVATAVTTPILITILATLGGVLVVGVGGGLVRPMQQRWESWLGRAEQELPEAKAQAQAYQRGREDVQRASAGAHTTSTGPIPAGSAQRGQGAPGSPTRGGPAQPGSIPPSGRTYPPNYPNR